MQDLRYAFRVLRKQPVFTLVAVLTMALGIGANTAVFSVLYQTLLRPLPVRDADRQVFIWNTYGSMLAQASVSIPDYLDRKTQAAAIEDATLFTMRTVNLNEGGTPEQLRALAVTPSFFSTLGLQPVLGQGFTEAQAVPDADKFVILSYGLWTSHFGADPRIVGRDLRVNADSYRVAGVLPAAFDLFGPDLAMLVPFSFTPAQRADTERGNEFSRMIARLRPGATTEQLDGQMKAITEEVIKRVPARADFMRGTHFGGVPVGLREQLVGDVRTPILVVQVCVVFVLFIACANVANLLLMRATRRHRELAVRSTLGAGRWHLIRPLAIEGMLIAVAGGVAGLMVGLGSLKALIVLAGDRLPGSPAAALDPAVLALTSGLVLVTGLVFGIVPALSASRGNAADALKDDSARGTAGRRTGSLRTALVIAEVAAAFILLFGAGLLIKSLVRLQAVNPGFSPDHVLTAEVALPRLRYPDVPARIAFWTQAVERVRAIPGVVAAGLTTNVPFNGNVSSGSYNIVGRATPPGQPSPHGRQEVIGGDYFAAMRIPILTGRAFRDGDTANAPPVVIIDQYLARKYFADRDPLGQQIAGFDPSKPPFTIVGVVGTISSIDLAQPVDKERLYFPTSQLGARSMALALRTSRDPLAIVPEVRAAMRAIDPEQPIAAVRTMDDWMARALQPRSAPTLLLTLFGAIALALSAIGIYGVLAFSVAQRFREFGIRQALGADPGSILRLVIGQGLRTAAVGTAIGLGGSLLLSKYLETLLYGVLPRDAGSLAGVAVVLLIVATAACYIPSRRATRADPLAALRMD